MTRAAALLVGCILACLPYLVYGTNAHPHAAHSDHSPRHGGELFMLGDYHVEIVRREARVEIFLSDATRKPLRPAAGRLVLHGGTSLEMRWQDQRLIAVPESDARIASYEVTTADGSVLPLSGEAMPALSARR